MKNVLSAIFAILILIFASSCVPEKIMSLEEETVVSTQQVDTIITFDPVTFEETVHIVTSDNTVTQKFSNDIYQIDTIITFNPDTYEETIQIVKTKIPADKQNN